MSRLGSLLFTTVRDPKLSGALAFIRIVAGIAFVIHGWGKIQNPFEWMGPNAGTPGIFQALAAVSEFFGGLGLLFGILTKPSALGIGATMVVAAYRHAFEWGDPFVSKGKGSYELALVYLSLSVLFIVCGAGIYSLDAVISRRTSRGA